MNWKRDVGVLLCLWGGLSATALRADVEIGTELIKAGTTIEVLEPGPDLQGIIDEIADEGSNKPYVIKLGPGEYTIVPKPITLLGLEMAPYISIVGSGRGVTILKGAVSSGSPTSSSAVVTGASNALLRDLTVENTGGNNYSFAIYNADGAAPRIDRVTAIASNGSVETVAVYNSSSSPAMTEVVATATGGDRCYGVRNIQSAAIMTEVVAMATGGTTCYGVQNSTQASSGPPRMTEVIAVAMGVNGGYGVSNSNSDLTMTDVTATASGAASFNWGVVVSFGSPTLSGVTATASGGSSAIGVYITGSGSPTMTRVRATGSEAPFAVGVAMQSSAAPRIRHSFLSGDAAISFGQSTGAQVSDSQLAGLNFDTHDDDPGTQCLRTYDENLADVTC